MFKIILIIHIIFGSLALLTFWIPLVAKKGLRLHIAGGIAYLTAMSAVILTASLLSLIRLSSQDSSLEQKHFAWFLLFISFLAGSSAWYGIRVWIFKTRMVRHTEFIDLSVSLLLLFVSISMSFYGYTLNNTLLIIFPIIGVFLSMSQLKYWLSVPKFKMHAWFQHMAAMFACVISTLTAFVVVGLPRVLSIKNENLLVWFGPTLIMVPILLIWQRFYYKKFKIGDKLKELKD